MEQQQQASLNELKDALEETLQTRGVLGSIKARIRAEIFQAIEDKSTPKPQLSNENLLINELIREYLDYNNYRHTLSVFLPETGQPQQTSFERSFMAKEINVKENPLYPQIPLLYSLLSRTTTSPSRHEPSTQQFSEPVSRTSGIIRLHPSREYFLKQILVQPEHPTLLTFTN